MDLEKYFISQIYTKFIGDDAALLHDTLLSQDAFFEGVHFKREWMSLKAVAKKAMLVNLSDAIAMNAVPKYALLTVAIPKDFSKEDTKELADGFNEVAKKWGVVIIGGDTIANTKLDISITILSYSKKPLFRKGIKQGDFLAFTGELGKSKKDLVKLLRGGKIHHKSKFLNITLRKSFIQKARRYLHVGMDISDGLFHDLEKLFLENRIGFSFLFDIPKRIGCSGEEYEMLVSFPKRHKKALFRIAKHTRTPLTIFATATRKRYKNRCKGWHFG